MIIAGIGLNSLNKNSIRKIILAGADVLRFNFSYRSIEENKNYIQIAHEIIDELNANVKILVDMPLNKVRLGDFDIKVFAVRENEEFVFQSASFSPDCNQFIPVNTSKLGQKVVINQTITIGDGEIALQVTEVIDQEKIKCKILNNGTISYIKTFNIKYTDTQKLIEDYNIILNAISQLKIDYIAYSYIDKSINSQINQIIKTYDSNEISNIIKIEKYFTEDIIKNIYNDPNYKMILIDRGEIGVNMPFEKSAIYQKNIIRMAKLYKKPIIISTQILESTVNYFTPYRSEISDLTNFVLDEIKGILLCHETTMGLRPAYSIKTAKKIIEEAEKYNIKRNQ
jgi:pyruvate kinase